jgi:hypothetical protein
LSQAHFTEVSFSVALTDRVAKKSTAS